jgi:DNA-binding response OmpR family regulator
VLDDNQDILDIIKEVLSYEKFEVNITSNSKHFMEIVKSYRPDLVILDYKLNYNKGDEICQQIKSHNQLFNTPVIICSAYLDNNINILACGCDAIIAKPFGLEELLDKVNVLIAA